jgi:hypothetical protein
MEELFTSKSDSPIEGRRKNNIQIISTLRSETENENSHEYEKHEKAKHQQQKYNISNNTKNTSYQNKRNDNIQDDIVNIAETIHNLANMMNEQIEKIASLEKEILKMKNIENKFDEFIINQKKDEVQAQVKKINDNSNNDKYVDINDSVNSSETEYMSILKKNVPINKQQKIIIPAKKNKIQDSCASETCNDYLLTKNVEHKLNSIATGFNDEIINMKKKQAMLMATFLPRRNKKC